jgi:hypothetical protein
MLALVKPLLKKKKNLKQTEINEDI